MAALLLLLAAWQDKPDDRYREAIEKGVTFPAEDEIKAWTAKGEHYKRALAILLDRANWAKALAALDERTGLWSGVLEIKVVFRELKEPAMGDGVSGRGEVALDVERLAKYEKSVMDYEKLKDKTVVLVPPARTRLILHHELAHCFQSMKQPVWFLEGVATFVANDGHFVAFFRNDKVKVKDVDEEYEHKHLYARGWAFLEFVKAKHGEEKLKKLLALTMKDGKPVQEAAAEVTGVAWEALKAQERDWSAKWISSFKVQK